VYDHRKPEAKKTLTALTLQRGLCVLQPMELLEIATVRAFLLQHEQ
jgi:hypothetical protein